MPQCHCTCRGAYGLRGNDRQSIAKLENEALIGVRQQKRPHVAAADFQRVAFQAFASIARSDSGRQAGLASVYPPLHGKAAPSCWYCPPVTSPGQGPVWQPGVIAANRIDHSEAPPQASSAPSRICHYRRAAVPHPRRSARSYGSFDAVREWSGLTGTFADLPVTWCMDNQRMLSGSNGNKKSPCECRGFGLLQMSAGTEGSSYGYSSPPAAWISASSIAPGEHMIFMKVPPVLLATIGRCGQLMAIRKRANRA